MVYFFVCKICSEHKKSGEKWRKIDKFSGLWYIVHKKIWSIK